MIGIVIVTHGRLADEFVKVVRDIVGQVKGVLAVCIDRGKAMYDARKEIEEAIKEAVEKAPSVSFPKAIEYARGE